MKETIVLGADHAGFKLKECAKAWLLKHGYKVEDEGTYSEESVDYPDFAEKVALRVRGRRNVLGVISCGSGIGISIAANKVPGIRAALICDVRAARLCRQHNDANIIALAGRPFSKTKVAHILRAWLTASFEGGRHKRRVDKIARIEKKYTQ